MSNQIIATVPISLSDPTLYWVENANLVNLPVSADVFTIEVANDWLEYAQSFDTENTYTLQDAPAEGDYTLAGKSLPPVKDLPPNH